MMDGPTGRLDVLHVVLRFDKGGLEMTALNLCRRLAKEGYRSAVLALDEGGATADLARSEGFECVVVGGRRPLHLSYHGQLARELRRLRPRALHTHHFSALLNILPASRWVGGMRLIHTEHSCAYLYHRPRYRRALRLASLGVDVFVPVGRSMEAFYREDVGIGPDRIRVIPNGVDTSVFLPASPTEKVAGRGRLGVDKFRVLIGSMGRLAPEKGYDLLLQAVAAAREGIGGLGLVLIGEGPDRAALEGEAARLGIADQVVFAGWRNDTADWYGILDAFVLSSRTEALPVALLEAMACGLPIVATAVGDVPAIVSQSGAGVVVPPGDAGALAAGLVSVLSDESLRRPMADRGRAWVVDRFSLDAMAAAYRGAYRLRSPEGSERSS